jgi:hypothetical protein
MSIRVVASLNVREIVTASRGLSEYAKGGGSLLSEKIFFAYKAKHSLCGPT